MKEGVFWYGTMSSGKSLTLITKVYNFRKANKIVDVFTFNGDYRYGVGRITTRFGKQSIEAKTYDENFSFKEYVKDKKIDYLFIDEAQFLKTWQVMELFFIYSLEFVMFIALDLKQILSKTSLKVLQHLLDILQEKKNLKQFVVDVEKKQNLMLE